MSEASKSCFLTLTTSTRPSFITVYVIFKNTHGICFISNFPKKIDVDNVAEPDLEASDISETIKFFWKHVPSVFLK